MIQTLLLACYELGHQPLSLAWPLAFLREEGMAVTAVDLSLSPFPQAAAKEADLVAIAVPMHTALRLGVQAAEQVRVVNPAAHICFYGMYAWLNRDYLLAGIADSVIGGEYEEPLAGLVEGLSEGEGFDKFSQQVPGVTTAYQESIPHIARLQFPVPDRRDLPALDQYARYMHNGSTKLAGYVEASRGCLHTCRHCPVVPVYNGRFFIIPAATVLADIRQQVAAGAGHISFGDPDFLNGPGHALKLARALHAEFPGLTFDFTTKVEHILKHRDLFPEFRRLGCSFVISAFESTSDRVLARLQKGHTVADMEAVLPILANAGIHVQPTWVPFTPWTTLNDYIEMLAWIRARSLIQHVPIVQLSVRLLVPPQSALLNHPDVADWLGPLDAANFTYLWPHADERMDRLQQEVAYLAEHGSDDPYEAFAAVEKLAYEMDGRSPPPQPLLTLYQPAPPRLTEDWFC
ncbi:MAG: radical SAM protein [Ardenticatenaceae bacterium]|nr:radical SAM protein [Ardenticatenaceae bacterium]